MRDISDRNNGARRLGGCFVFLEGAASAFPYPVEAYHHSSPLLQPSSQERKVAVSKRQKPEGMVGRLCPTLYPSRPPAGCMISHLFRRLISSRQPFRYFLSLSLSLSFSFLSFSVYSSASSSCHLRLDPTSKTTERHHQGPFSASSLSINRGVD